MSIVKKLLLVKMDDGSSSTIVHVPPNPTELKIRDMKQDLKLLQNQFNAIDYEGGRRLDHMSKDFVFLRKKIKQKVKRSENLLSRQLAELEIKVDKLALKIVKHEASGSDMSSSYGRVEYVFSWNILLVSHFPYI